MCPAWAFSSLRLQVDEETMLETFGQRFMGHQRPYSLVFKTPSDVMFNLNDDDTIEQNSACRGSYLAVRSRGFSEVLMSAHDKRLGFALRRVCASALAFACPCIDA